MTLIQDINKCKYDFISTIIVILDISIRSVHIINALLRFNTHHKTYLKSKGK